MNLGSFFFKLRSFEVMMFCRTLGAVACLLHLPHRNSSKHHFQFQAWVKSVSPLSLALQMLREEFKQSICPTMSYAKLLTAFRQWRRRLFCCWTFCSFCWSAAPSEWHLDRSRKVEEGRIVNQVHQATARQRCRVPARLSRMAWPAAIFNMA